MIKTKKRLEFKIVAVILISSLSFFPMLNCGGGGGGGGGGEGTPSSPGISSSVVSDGQGAFTLTFGSKSYSFILHNIYDPMPQTLAGIQVDGYLKDGILTIHVEGNDNYFPAVESLETVSLVNGQYLGLLPRGISSDTYTVQSEEVSQASDFGNYLETMNGSEALDFVYTNYPQTNAVLVFNDPAYDDFATTSFKIFKSNVPDTMILVKDGGLASVLFNLIMPKQAKAVFWMIPVVIILGTVVIAAAKAAIQQTINQNKNKIKVPITLSSPSDGAIISDISARNFTYEFNNDAFDGRYGVFEFMIGTDKINLFNNKVGTIVLAKIDRNAPMKQTPVILRFSPKEFASLKTNVTYYWGIRVTPYEGPSNQVIWSFKYTGPTFPAVPLDPLTLDKDNDGYSPTQGDCNDNNPNQNPGKPEICGDLIDNDCSGGDLRCPQSPTNRPPRVIVEAYINHIMTGEAVEISCNAQDPDFDPITYSWTSSDGLIIDSSINDQHPWRVTWLAESLADGNYQITCMASDGEASTSGSVSVMVGSPVVCQDNDSDGYYSTAGCDTLVDCDDNNINVRPGASEECDGIDNQCPGDVGYGTVDEECPTPLGTNVRITFDASGSWDPSLIWTSSQYGVSWTDYRDGNAEIYFARISSAGAKLGSDVRITSDASDSLYPFLVWTGSQYGVSWEDYRDGNAEIYFARVSEAGTKLGSDIRITSDASDSWSPSLVWTGSQYGVSWQDFRNDGDGLCDSGSGTMDCNYEIYFARISSAGAKLGSDVRITSNADISEFPSLVWTLSEYGVSWDASPDGFFGDIYFARISSAGAKIGSDVRITSSANGSGGPSLVWTGSQYGVSWEDPGDNNYEIYFARISSAGAKLGSDVQITSATNASRFPSLVWTTSEYGVSWDDYRDLNNEIYFARISSSGSKLGSDIRITSDASYSEIPSLVWTGSEHGVSWLDSRDGNIEIYFARIGLIVGP
ncbi:MAG TPA: MopE-related protein [bacterium]|nr:MopE-related protein [bacterium]